jgi:hypothetical protein
MREWLVNKLADGHKGNADLVAYFLLRVHRLLTNRGTLGIIATNSVAQGESREVGLDRMNEDGFTITRSIQSRPWPVSTASLQYAAVWGTHQSLATWIPRVSDETSVRRISTLLEPGGEVEDWRERLTENADVAFQGTNVNCVDEFTMSPTQAQDWVRDDPSLDDVLYPYLGGKDLNSRPAGDASRWIVDFTGIDENQIDEFGEAYKWVYTRVRPVRATLANKPRVQRRWWAYEAPGIDMRLAIAELDEVLAITLVSTTLMPLRVPTSQVFSHALGVFATASYGDQAVLSSSVHQTWAVKYASGMCQLPRSWDHREGVFATVMGPPDCQ